MLAPPSSEVVLLNGPPGVGKSTVSRLLFTRWSGAVWIRGDDVRVRFGTTVFITTD